MAQQTTINSLVIYEGYEMDRELAYIEITDMADFGAAVAEWTRYAEDNGMHAEIGFNTATEAFIVIYNPTDAD